MNLATKSFDLVIIGIRGSSVSCRPLDLNLAPECSSEPYSFDDNSIDAVVRLSFVPGVVYVETEERFTHSTSCLCGDLGSHASANL